MGGAPDHVTSWILTTCVAIAIFMSGSCALTLNIDSPQGESTEYFKVHQNTQLVRHKRDDVNHVIFPETMDFTLQFEDGPLRVTLRRNEYMRTNVQLTSDDGPLQHDLGRKTCIYKDLNTFAAFVVKCEDHLEHCTLRGGMHRNGSKWDIHPEHNTPQLHKALVSSSDATDLRHRLIKDSIPPPTLDTMLHRNKYIQNSNASDAKSRQKRQIPDCNIVELYSVCDETVWEFFLLKNGNDESAATSDLATELLALYSQADLHYDFIPVRRPGACLRMYYVGGKIQKDRATSWSVEGEVTIDGGLFVNTDPSLINCGADGNAERGTLQFDLIQCFTRKNLVFNEGVPGGPLLAYHRSVAFDSTCCVVAFLPFSSAVIEMYGDKVELLIAHEIAHALDSQHDSEIGCSDEDSYIMSNEVVINVDDLKLRNIWYFSVCSLDAIFNHIATNPPCLEDNAFTDADYSAFKDVPLAGFDHTWDDQCVYRFGVGSVRCDPTGQNRTFFDDMCARGIFCTDPDADGNCTGQGRPYDGTACGDFDAYCVKGDCFIPPRQNGVVCSNITDCADPNASCQPETATCECDEGFYDINGTCIPQGQVGDACLQSDGCLDPNAECVNSTCVCKERYFEFTSNKTCGLKVGYGESCAVTEQCFGNNTICFDHPSTCQCLEGFYIDEESGNCLPAKPLDESCAKGQCLDPNAYCDPGTDTCQCAPGFYDDNGPTAEGTCIPQVPIGSACPFDDACLDPNAECAEGVCTCLPQFYNNGSACTPKKPYGEMCDSADECFGANITCSGTPKTCRCPVDFYIDEEVGDCLPVKALGETCKTGQCVTPNAQCDSVRDICRCIDGFYADEGTGLCTEKKVLDQACTQPDACLDPNTECSSGTCSCVDGFYDNNGMCEPVRAYGETCVMTSDCVGDNIECSGLPQTCRCPVGFYIDAESGNCLTAKNLSESCLPGQCGTPNSFCDTLIETCQCQEGFDNDNGNCTSTGVFTNRQLGETCENTRQCVDTNATCSGALGTCECRDDFYDDNGDPIGGSCQPKEPIGVSCPQPDACQDPNAICNGSQVCACPADYFVNGDVCELLKSIGQNCTFAGECRGGNVDCTGAIPTCRCPDDRFLNVETGNCDTGKNLGEACEEGQCKTPNSCCDSFDVCACRPGFFQIEGSCEPKVDLGENCLSVSGSCIDPNAVCITTCVCSGGFTNVEGTCIVGDGSGIPLGGACETSAQCQTPMADCFGSPQTCRCPPDSYIDLDQGMCVPKLALGVSCEPGQCASNFICSTRTKTCVCERGTTFDGTKCSWCVLPFVEFGDSCYFFGTDELTYELARIGCDFYDKPGVESSLVQVDSVEELKFLKEFMHRRFHQPLFGYWNDLFEVSHGVEKWRSSGDPLIVSDYDKGEPDDFWTQQSCTMFMKNSGYRQGDVECRNSVNRREPDVRSAFKLCELKFHEPTTGLGGPRPPAPVK